VRAAVLVDNCSGRHSRPYLNQERKAMTWALCLNCGEVKFGAICPCPKCQVSSTGDMQLDITFSDHRMSKESLEQLGAVVAKIHEVSDDDEFCFWTFIYYVSTNHPEILGVDLNSEKQAKCQQLLESVTLPPVEIQPGRHWQDDE
jgi:hypothetical protein